MHGIGSHLADYLLSPSAVIAVVIPGMTSLIILTAYLYASRVSGRLWLLWAVCLPKGQRLVLPWQSTSGLDL